MGSKGNQKLKVAIIGTNGLPARYGGFETLTDKLTKELNHKFDFTVYCSQTKKGDRLKSYNNSNLLYLPFKANGFQSFIYDTISIFHAWLTSDVLLILGPTAGYILPLNIFFGKRIIVNHGGLNEWEREKFTWIEKKYLKYNHKIAAKVADKNVTDNFLLRDSIKDLFHQDSEVIRYGGDHVTKIEIESKHLDKYPFLNDKYAVSVSRAQKDNNLHMVLEAFESLNEMKLVLISNWNVSKYGKDLRAKYKDKSDNIVILDAIYDANELNLIRGNAMVYIHTHSQCGTAPSLVEAICLDLPIISYDVPTNRETTQNKVMYFNNKNELIEIINNVTESKLNKIKGKLITLASKEYTWKIISEQYNELFIK
jgi:glycosyltransferase involved in cell wall biosynthesis